MNAHLKLKELFRFFLLAEAVLCCSPHGCEPKLPAKILFF